MPPKTNAALRALAQQDTDGLYSARLEAAIDETTATVIDALGLELGSKSKAARLLLRKGAVQLLSERTRVSRSTTRRKHAPPVG